MCTHANGGRPALLQLNREMLNANARIEQRHHWDSYWWEWPLNMRGVLYYSKPDTNAKSVLVYLLGNPTVLWQVAAFMLSSLLYIVVRGRQLMSRPRTQRAKLSPNMDLTPILFCLIAYVLNLAPYILVRRSCFTYHYMPALMYGHVCVGLMIDRLFRNSHLRLLVLTLCATIACVGFYAYAPWIYALRTCPAPPGALLTARTLAGAHLSVCSQRVVVYRTARVHLRHSCPPPLCAALTHDGHAMRRWLPRWD
ncbi:hypothetical protein EON66_04335 [archaeon]|nr:MAG: hypothetical protein EON66_04335 [archaeon]